MSGNDRRPMVFFDGAGGLALGRSVACRDGGEPVTSRRRIAYGAWMSGAGAFSRARRASSNRPRAPATSAANMRAGAGGHSTSPLPEVPVNVGRPTKVTSMVTGSVTAITLLLPWRPPTVVGGGTGLDILLILDVALDHC